MFQIRGFQIDDFGLMRYHYSQNKMGSILLTPLIIIARNFVKYLFSGIEPKQKRSKTKNKKTKLNPPEYLLSSQ